MGAAEGAAVAAAVVAEGGGKKPQTGIWIKTQQACSTKFPEERKKCAKNDWVTEKRNYRRVLPRFFTFCCRRKAKTSLYWTMMTRSLFLQLTRRHFRKKKKREKGLVCIIIWTGPSRTRRRCFFREINFAFSLGPFPWTVEKALTRIVLPLYIFWTFLCAGRKSQAMFVRSCLCNPYFLRSENVTWLENIRFPFIGLSVFFFAIVHVTCLILEWSRAEILGALRFLAKVI